MRDDAPPAPDRATDEEDAGDAGVTDDAASPDAVERLARRFDAEGRPYARVTVVRREPPVSATVGDRALVTPEGDLFGWVGGVACAQSVVVREATEALRRGEPALVGLAPDPESVERPGLDAFPMRCHSEGTLELFVDPVVPAPRLVVVGNSPLTRTLVRFASELAFDVTVVADDDAESFDGADEVRVATGDADVESVLDGASFVVVGSMGRIDERVVESAVRTGVDYVALVASEDRAETLFDAVADRLDCDVDEVRATVQSPAGLDIGAETPDEIAVSVLAELVAVRRSSDAAPGDVGSHVDVADAGGSDASDDVADAGGSDASDDVSDDEGTAVPDDRPGASDDADAAVDPVCGMDVAVDDAAATATFEGETYHFCGEGCADAFRSDPERYLDGGEVS